MNIVAIDNQAGGANPGLGNLAAGTECTTLPATARSVLTLVTPRSSRRDEHENFIASRFEKSYGARITDFFPLLLARHDQGRISATVGLRPGLDRPFFLEQYLEHSLEEAIADLSHTPVQREDLIEIGNLASGDRPASQLLFILLTAILYEAGYSWVVFTATEQIRLLLKRLHLQPITLCEANPERLRGAGQEWGSYYHACPKVQAGSVDAAMAALMENQFARALILQYEGQVLALADSLRLARSGERLEA